jgi:hypothetical protein
VSCTGKLEAKSGMFESSFAAGLDLSEFGLPLKRQESAAAELLCVKMEESHEASQEEQEETWIQEVAKAKGKELQSLVLEEYGSQQNAAPQASHRNGCVLLSVQTISLVVIFVGSVGAIVLDSYDTRESDLLLKPVLHRRDIH